MGRFVMTVDSIELRDECPECSHAPLPEEQVRFWQVDTEIGRIHSVECPDCSNRYIFAMQTDLQRLPPIEDLLQWIEEMGM